MKGGSATHFVLPQRITIKRCFCCECVLHCGEQAGTGATALSARPHAYYAVGQDLVKIVDFVAQSNTITELDLGLCERQPITAFQHMGRLRVRKLSFQIPLFRGKDDVDAFLNALPVTVEDLKIGDMYGNVRGIAPLCHYAAREQIVRLTLEKVPFEDDEIRLLCGAVQGRRSPISLSLVGVRISDTAVRCLIDLVQCDAMHTFFLSRLCHDTNVGVVTDLVRAVCASKTLTAFGLSGMTISDEAASAIALVLGKSLQALYLDHNNFSVESVSKIVRSLTPRSRIRALGLYRTSDFYDNEQVDANCCLTHVQDMLLREVPVARLSICVRSHARLAQSLRSNGFVRELCTGSSCGSGREAIDALLHRNKRMHERARVAVLTLMALKSKRKLHCLYFVPHPVVREIAALVWSTRGDIELWSNK